MLLISLFVNPHVNNLKRLIVSLLILMLLVKKKQFFGWCCKCWLKGEKICCVVIGSVLTISWFKKCDGVGISFCFKFLALLKISCILSNGNFKLLLVVYRLRVWFQLLVEIFFDNLCVWKKLQLPHLKYNLRF